MLLLSDRYLSTILPQNLKDNASMREVMMLSNGIKQVDTALDALANNIPTATVNLADMQAFAAAHG